MKIIHAILGIVLFFPLCAYSQQVIELTEDTVESVVKKATKPVVIDFYAVWCSPCKMVKPVFAECAAELHNDYTFVSANIDTVRELAREYGVTSIPTFVIVKDGKKVGSFSGYRAKKALIQDIKKIISTGKPLPLTHAEIGQQFFIVIAQHNMDGLKKLINSGYDVNIELDVPAEAMVSFKTITPLAVALSSGWKEGAQLLIDAGARLDNKLIQQVRGTFEQAHDKLKTMKNMLACSLAREKECAVGAPKQDVKITGSDAISKYIEALINHDVKSVNKLIADGVDINAIMDDPMGGKKQTSVLGFAFFVGNQLVINALIDAGASFAMKVRAENGQEATIADVISNEIISLEQQYKELESIVTSFEATIKKSPKKNNNK